MRSSDRKRATLAVVAEDAVERDHKYQSARRFEVLAGLLSQFDSWGLVYIRVKMRADAQGQACGPEGGEQQEVDRQAGNAHGRASEMMVPMPRS